MPIYYGGKDGLFKGGLGDVEAYRRAQAASAPAPASTPEFHTASDRLAWERGQADLAARRAARASAAPAAPAAEAPTGLRGRAAQMGRRAAAAVPEELKLRTTAQTLDSGAAQRMSRARQLLNGTYGAVRAERLPPSAGATGRVSGALRGAAEGFKAAPEVAEGAKQPGRVSRAASATARTVSGAVKGASAASATPAAQAAMPRLLGRRALSLAGRTATPLAAIGSAAGSISQATNGDRERYNKVVYGDEQSGVLGDAGRVMHNLGNALTFGGAERLGNAASSALAGDGFAAGWNQKTVDEKIADMRAAEENPAAQLAPASQKAAAAVNPGTGEGINWRAPVTQQELETNQRVRRAAQAPGVGAVNLGASGIYGGTKAAGRRSLASSVDRNGVPTYDNASIERMLARNGDAPLAEQRAAAAAAPQYRAPASDLRAAPSSQASGGVISGDTLGAEAERKKRMSELDSAMFQLGSLNMRSKRDMYMSMLKGKQDLSSMNYDTQNKRDMQRAQLDQETSLANARLAEEAAGRRDKMGQFNTELDWNKDKFGQEMTWDQQKTALGLMQRRSEAGARAATDEARLQMDGLKYQNERADAYVQRYMDRNPEASIDDAMNAFEKHNLDTGGGYSNSDASRQGNYNVDAGASRRFSESPGWVDNVIATGNVAPWDYDNLAPGNVPDISQIEFEDTPWYARGKIGTATDAAGKKVSRRYSNEEADAILAERWRRNNAR